MHLKRYFQWIFSLITDINECAPDGSNDCHEHATCTNTDGGFTCACKSGFTGDGKTCTGNSHIDQI